MKTKRTMPPVVAVLAKDWALYGEEAEFDYEFDLITGWIVGLLISEDDEKIIITHQWFPGDDRVRRTSVLPKGNIVERIDYAANVQQFNKEENSNG